MIGIDQADEILEHARSYARDKGVKNVRFEQASIYDLPFQDAGFNAAYAHQLLQHLADPAAALREMSRILRPGAILAVRDADYGTMTHHPHDPLPDRWFEIYHQVARANGGEPAAGRRLLGWVQSAGFVKPQATTSTWTYADPEGRAHWSELWVGRLVVSHFADQAQELGVTDREELQAISEAFRRWANRTDSLLFSTEK